MVVVVIVVDDLFAVVVLTPTFVVVVVAAAAVVVVAQGWSFHEPCDRVNLTIWPFPWRRLPLSCSFRSCIRSTHQQRSIATAL